MMENLRVYCVLDVWDFLRIGFLGEDAEGENGA